MINQLNTQIFSLPYLGKLDKSYDQFPEKIKIQYLLCLKQSISDLQLNGFGIILNYRKKQSSLSVKLQVLKINETKRIDFQKSLEKKPKIKKQGQWH